MWPEDSGMEVGGTFYGGRARRAGWARLGFRRGDFDLRWASWAHFLWGWRSRGGLSLFAELKFPFCWWLSEKQSSSSLHFFWNQKFATVHLKHSTGRAECRLKTAANCRDFDFYFWKDTWQKNKKITINYKKKIVHLLNRPWFWQHSRYRLLNF